jgi:hypothetical protein
MPDQVNGFLSWVAKYWLWILVPALFLFILPVLTPGFIYSWSFRGFKTLFHDDLGMGEAWSNVAAVGCAFGYAIALPVAFRWMAFGRRRIRAFLAVMVVFGITPLLHALFDTPFSQSTGAAQKYYAFVGDDIIISDSPGFDPSSGVERRPLTREVARIIDRRNKGLRPQPISGDSRQLTFFDSITGRPRVWYYKSSDGKFELFDSEGFYPGSGELLLPVTREIAAEITKQRNAENAQAVADARERARKELDK